MPTYEVKIAQIIAIVVALCIGGAEPAWADRYLEKFDLRNSQGERSEAARVYIRSSKMFRSQGHHYLADYFAARGHALSATGKNPNINPDLEEVFQEMDAPEFSKVYSKIVEKFKCRTLRDRNDAYLQSALILDEIIFRFAESEQPPHSRQIRSLDQYEESMRIASDCDLHTSVDMTNFTSALWQFSIGTQPPATSTPEDYSPTVEFYQGPFGKRLVESDSAHEPCVVSRDQKLLYYDIDKPTLDREINIFLLTNFTETQSHSGSIVVEGHADTSGPRWRNLQIAEQRAVNVAREMVRLGISEQRIKVQSLGAYCSQVVMGSDAYVQANRRVSIRAVK